MMPTAKTVAARPIQRKFRHLVRMEFSTQLSKAGSCETGMKRGTRPALEREHSGRCDFLLKEHGTDGTHSLQDAS